MEQKRRIFILSYHWSDCAGRISPTCCRAEPLFFFTMDESSHADEREMTEEIYDE